MGTEYLSYMKSIATFAPTFYGYIISVLASVQGNHLDSYTIILESFMSFRGPLFRKPVTDQELLFCCFLQQTGFCKVSSLQFGDCAAADKIDPMMI